MTTRRPAKRILHRTIHRGFTLIELAVAMFVIALLLGSILVPLATQVEQRQVSETQKTMDDIRDALIGFAVANGHLPCPDARLDQPGTTPIAGQNDGVEDFDTATGDCQTQFSTISSGTLPWATLGLGNQDAWGNRFRYIVVTAFARRTPSPTFTTTTPLPTPLRLCDNSTCSGSVPSTVSVAIVISHGGNGFSAMNPLSLDPLRRNPLPPATALDELRNTDTTLDKVSRTKSTLAGNEFDDMVISLSRFTLINRMVAAGKLP